LLNQLSDFLQCFDADG